ncbi:dihydroorotase [Vampirovibrio sp.]|uniref:dihydroorotase n=1 Tax=Vampirovibrio sp. TaxID=2717857 RepID=UPI0035939EC7
MKKLLKGGRVLDPASGLDAVMDVLIDGNVIAAIETDIPGSSADEVIELHAGQWVAPGLVDVHVHFRDPGSPDKETTETGAAAAVAGGFTTVCVMPNTSPVIDSTPMVQYILNAAQSTGIQIFPIAAVTRGLEGEEMTSIGTLLSQGAVGFSDDGRPVASANMMRKALEYSNMFDVPIVCHAEDCTLFGNGVMHEGYYSTLLGLPGIPSVAESVMVARDIELARFTGGRVHFAHISSKESVSLIRKAKAEGLRITAETTPHYLALTDACCQAYDPDFKMNGPLRGEADQKALIEAVMDGTIDVIATDHAPHTPDEKSMAFDCAPNGVIGLETSLSIMLTHFYHTKKLNPLDLIAMMSTRPAEIFKLKHSGRLAVGERADVVVIDPEQSWVVDPAQFHSKSRNTPFKGQTLKGRAILTLANGQCLYQQSSLLKRSAMAV